MGLGMETSLAANKRSNTPFLYWLLTHAEQELCCRTSKENSLAVWGDILKRWFILFLPALLPLAYSLSLIADV